MAKKETIDVFEELSIFTKEDQKKYIEKSLDNVRADLTIHIFNAKMYSDIAIPELRDKVKATKVKDEKKYYTQLLNQQLDVLRQTKESIKMTQKYVLMLEDHLEKF